MKKQTKANIEANKRTKKQTYKQVYKNKHTNVEKTHNQPTKRINVAKKKHTNKKIVSHK